MELLDKEKCQEEIRTLTQGCDPLGHGNIFGRFCQAKKRPDMKR